MRLAHARALCTLLAVSVAVLCGAVSGAGDAMANVTRVLRSVPPHHQHRVLFADRTVEEEATAMWKRQHWHKMKSIMQQEGANGKEVQCCPSVLEMVVQKGGENPDGVYAELYEDDVNKQRFYELSCAPGVVDKPCRFVDARLYNQSRCVQKYSYTYALVRYINKKSEGQIIVPGSGGWSMDYVKVRAGCECQITPKRRPHRQPTVPNNHRHTRSRKKEKLRELSPT